MNARTLILLVTAFAFAAGMAFFVRSKLSDPQQANTATVRVIAAASDIPAGSFIRTEKHLKWVQWPRANVMPIFLSEKKHSLEEFSGSVARRSIAAGEPITTNALVKSDEGGFMAAVLTPGARAVSISVNPTTGNAGFIFPGDRVDLILTHEISVAATGEGEAVLASETFVENVRVLAVDQKLDNPENKAMLAKTITVEVTPKQAEKINVATRLGQISLSLRSLSGKRQETGMGGPEIPLGDRAESIADAAPPAANDNSLDSYTRDSDVSRLLSGRGNVHSRVNVIRGDEAEIHDFLRKAE